MLKTIRVLLCAIILAAVAARAEEALRTWTSTSGATLEAELVGFDGKLVKLRSADGKMMGIPLNRLSPADRAWVAGQAAPSDAPVEPAAEPAKPVEAGQEIKALRAFADGDWTGYNAYYSESYFDAGLRPDGQVEVFLKNRKGERVGTPVSMTAHYMERDVATGDYKPVNVVAFLDDPDPAKRMGDMTWRGKLANGMLIETGVAFSRAGIEIWTAPIDNPVPPDAPHPYVAVRAPKTFEIGQEMPLEKKKEIAGSATLVIQPDSGSPAKVAYYDRYAFPKAAKEIRIDDLYESRTIAFKAASVRHAPLRSLRSHTISPYAGFEIGAFSEDKAGGRKQALVCTIK
jgi:hypothetical protein